MTDFNQVKKFHQEVSKVFVHQVAIRQGDSVYTLARPRRHCDVIRYMAEECGLPTPITGEQGFIDSKGRFLDRRMAAQLALANGQVKELKYQPDTLFSEDLW